jgi:hypothetical protein
MSSVLTTAQAMKMEANLQAINGNRRSSSLRSTRRDKTRPSQSAPVASNSTGMCPSLKSRSRTTATASRVEYPCGQCRTNCQSDCLICTPCQTWFHFKCSGLDERELDFHIRNPEEDWICPQCAAAESATSPETTPVVDSFVPCTDYASFTDEPDILLPTPLPPVSTPLPSESPQPTPLPPGFSHFPEDLRTSEKSSDLIFVAYNVNRLESRLCEFLQFLDTVNPDVVLLSETKYPDGCVPKSTVRSLFDRGYRSEWSGRPISKGGGGTAVIMKKCFHNVRRLKA